MPRQRAIRFPDDLDAKIEAEAQRLGYPHSFSSVVVNAARQTLEAKPAGQQDRPSAATVVEQRPSTAPASPRAPGDDVLLERGDNAVWMLGSSPPTDLAPMCRMCAKAGPPKSHPCPTCGYQTRTS